MAAAVSLPREPGVLWCGSALFAKVAGLGDCESVMHMAPRVNIGCQRTIHGHAGGERGVRDVGWPLERKGVPEDVLLSGDGCFTVQTV